MEREAVTMNEQTKELLKKKIQEADLISFDIFDTLLFRKTNTPETVFDLMGKHLGVHGFRKLRMDEQNEAMMGRTLEVLVDGYDEEFEQYFGRTYADSPDIDGRVWIATQDDITEGSFVKVCIEGLIDGDLTGYVVEE